MDYYEETFGPCPHGYIKPYCGQCASDEAEVEAQERAQRAETRENVQLRRKVGHQSEALDAAYGHIRELERRIQQPVVRVPRLPGRRRHR